MQTKTMAEPTRFQIGDEVKHPKRPEWGGGRVLDIAAIQHKGKRVQRVTVDFANHKRLVINTGIAPLELTYRPPDDNTPNPLRQPSKFQLNGHSFEKKHEVVESEHSGQDPGEKGWLDEMEGTPGDAAELWSLPDDCTNPFASPEAKLRATLRTFRFNTEAKPLADWAVAQTGLNDPLSKFTRHELQQAFPRFERDRNQHLFMLVREFKHRNQLDLVHDIADEVGIPAAKNQVKKILKG